MKRPKLTDRKTGLGFNNIINPPLSKKQYI